MFTMSGLYNQHFLDVACMFMKVRTRSPEIPAGKKLQLGEEFFMLAEF